MHGITEMGKRYKPPLEQRARPTSHRMRKAGNDWERGDTGQLTMRDAPLERALARKVITREQYNAGVKFRHHWYHAGLSGGLASADLARVAAQVFDGCGMARSEAETFHRNRYRGAVEAVGKIGSSVLEKAVCYERPLEEIGYSLGWKSRSSAITAATERLKAALERLQQLWGGGT